jgi:transcriptional regulator with XRE-family HTH domain
MADDSTVGDRVRRLAKLHGLTQDDLRRATGLSLRTIKDVMGDHGNHRNETLHKIAVALQVRTSDLTSPGEREAQTMRGEPWEDVRDALYRRTPGPGPDEPATAADVLAALADLTPAWRAGEYSQVRPALPGLVHDALSLNGSEEDRGAKSRALSATAWILNMTRQFDDAWTAARLAMDAAPDLPDTLAAVSMQCWCLLRQGRAADAGELATEWSDLAEPRSWRRATTK